jgi:hypothetical protein
MFKRYIYNTLGILSFITPLIISIISLGWRTITFMFFIYLIYLVISLIALVIDGLVTSDFKDPDGLVPFMLFFFFIKDKRIYYSDLGYFYIRPNNNGDKVYLYKQGYFFYSKIGSVYYNGNTESLSKEIKSELDTIYKKELERIRVKKSIKDWDGYLDLPSKRDDKLNQLIN